MLYLSFFSTTNALQQEIAMLLYERIRLSNNLLKIFSILMLMPKLKDKRE